MVSVGGLTLEYVHGPAFTIAIRPLAFTLMAYGSDLWRALGVGVMNRSVAADTAIYYGQDSQYPAPHAALGGLCRRADLRDWYESGYGFWKNWTCLRRSVAFALYGIMLAELLVAPIVSRLGVEPEWRGRLMYHRRAHLGGTEHARSSQRMRPEPTAAAWRLFAADARTSSIVGVRVYRIEHAPRTGAVNLQ